MLRTLDHRVAALGALIAAASLLIVNGFAGDADLLARDGPVPVSPREEARARTELAHRLARGAAGPWWVEYAFRRTTPAGPLRAEVEVVNRPPDELTAAFGGLNGRWRGRTVDCSQGPAGKVCGPGALASSRASDASTFAEATDPARGWYSVQPRPATRVAGEPARCFRLAANGRPGRLLYGTSTSWCLTADGIVVRSVVARSDSRDVSTATRVRRTVTGADFDALLRGFPIGSG